MTEPKTATAVNVLAGENAILVELADGRSISAPLAWYPRLLHAAPEDRNNWKLEGRGYGIHWPEIDDDKSASRV